MEKRERYSPYILLQILTEVSLGNVITNDWQDLWSFTGNAIIL